jgi:hypothetical protein
MRTSRYVPRQGHFCPEKRREPLSLTPGDPCASCFLLLQLNIDSSLSWEQLNAPDVNFSVLRPMIATYTRVRSPAIIYALLLNRVQFLRLADSTLSFASLQRTRADLCELLSIKLARVFASTDLELVDVLSRSWNPYAGAPESVAASVDMSDVEDDMQNALELAITSQAKCQQVPILFP